MNYILSLSIMLVSFGPLISSVSINNFHSSGDVTGFNSLKPKKAKSGSSTLIENVVLLKPVFVTVCLMYLVVPN